MEATADHIPCEICNTLVAFSEYNNHLSRCIRYSRITGFIVRQQQINQRQTAHHDDNDNDYDDDNDNEADSEYEHSREISNYTSYFTRNSQVSGGITLRDFINDHFAGVNSPPTRSVVWFNIASTSALSGSTTSTYNNNLRIGENIGNVEIGLTENQLKEVSYTSLSKNELILEKDDICPICQENLCDTIDADNPVTMLACSHMYCETCINKWLIKHKKCPVCNVDLEDAYCWGR